MKYPVFNN